VKKPRLTQHSFAEDLTCRECGLGFQFRHADCEGATEAGRLEIRRRLEAERQDAVERRARATAVHFAELAKARRTR